MVCITAPMCSGTDLVFILLVSDFSPLDRLLDSLFLEP